MISTGESHRRVLHRRLKRRVSKRTKSKSSFVTFFHYHGFHILSFLINQNGASRLIRLSKRIKV